MLVRVVLTAIGPGNNAATTPAAHMPASISAMKTRPARAQVIAPIMASPRVTAGLNNPPLIRKNTQTFTAKLKPKTSEIYSNTGAFGA